MSADAHNTAPSRLLIVLLGAIGDVVRALPLLHRIRRAWPDTHTVWAVEPKSEPILRNHPWLDDVIIYNRGAAPWSFIPFLARVRRGHFDLVLDLQRHLKSGLVSSASGASDRLGFAAENTKEFNHRFSTRTIAPQPNFKLKLQQYQAFGDALGLAPASIQFGLQASTEERREVHSMLEKVPRPLIGVILGSSWPSRIYPAESIAAVIRMLSQPGENRPALFPLLLGGPEDRELAAAVSSRLGDGCLDLSGRTSLRHLFEIFRHCVVAFGPDSGPMHIAAAVGCPVVSLWGATAPERSAPWGFEMLTLRGDIPCHPCYLRRCPIERQCMRRIAPAQVVAMVSRALLPARVAQEGTA